MLPVLWSLRFFLPAFRKADGNNASTLSSLAGLALTNLTEYGIIFRSEIAVLLVAYTWYFLLVRQQLTVKRVIAAGVPGAIVGLGLTMPVDSFFWQRPTWPEFNSFWFNVMEGRSSDWGTSLFHYYFTSALPKLLLNPMTYGVCLPVALATPALRQSSLDLLIPNLAFIVLYSFQPHKEWRFIVYSVPIVTAVCARGASYIWDRRSKSKRLSVLSLLLVLSILVSFAYSTVSLIISSLNYPGAVALHRLHALHGHDFLQQPATVSVHMDVLTCQTGATLFLQQPPPVASGSDNATVWTFDKTDSKTGDGTAVLRPDFWAQFDYALAERPEKLIGRWDVLDTVYGYEGVKLVRPGEPWGAGSASEEAWYDPLKGHTRARQWGEGPWAGVGRKLRMQWLRVGSWTRKTMTRGWWFDVRMAPMIRILRRERIATLTPTGKNTRRVEREA